MNLPPKDWLGNLTPLEAHPKTRIGIATGVTMGLAVSVGGMFSPVFGRIGDTLGLTASMWTIVGLTCAALSFAFVLPPHARRLPYVRSGKPSPASAS